MITPVTHVNPLTYVRRARMLPDKGQILVSINQHVNAGDIVAESLTSGQHLNLDLRKALNMNTSDAEQTELAYKVGEKIEKGDILTQTGGLLARVVRSPVNGKIVAIEHGQVIIEHSNQKLELIAGISGNIAEILPDRGVVIEANGALIQGMWGNGRIDQSLLVITDQPAEEELIPGALDISMRGGILLAGHVTKAAVLQAALELPVRGLIIPSMTANLIPIAQKMTYPIMLTEGFGQVPMNYTTFQLLATNEKREICLNAEWNQARGEKPEAFIPLPAQGNPSQDYTELAAGNNVRVLVPPYSGQSAVMVSIRPGYYRLPNGLKTEAANVRLTNGQIVTVPLSNLDVLE